MKTTDNTTTKKEVGGGRERVERLLHPPPNTFQFTQRQAPQKTQLTLSTDSTTTITRDTTQALSRLESFRTGMSQSQS